MPFNPSGCSDCDVVIENEFPAVNTGGLLIKLFRSWPNTWA